jgi:hypothetical protein
VNLTKAKKVDEVFSAIAEQTGLTINQVAKVLAAYEKIVDAEKLAKKAEREAKQQAAFNKLMGAA